MGGFSHLGFWSGNLFLIAPFLVLCLLVPFQMKRWTRSHHCLNANECKEAATHYCREGCDYLCQYCEVVHRRRRATQSHNAMVIHAHLKTSKNETNLLSCTCGKVKQAIFYCKLHETLACFGCQGENHLRCHLLLINDIGPSQGMDSEICTNNEKINLLKKRLRKLDFEMENDQRKLSLSIDSSKKT